MNYFFQLRPYFQFVLFTLPQRSPNRIIFLFLRFNSISFHISKLDELKKKNPKKETKNPMSTSQETDLLAQLQLLKAQLAQKDQLLAQQAQQLTIANARINELTTVPHASQIVPLTMGNSSQHISSIQGQMSHRTSFNGMDLPKSPSLSTGRQSGNLKVHFTFGAEVSSQHSNNNNNNNNPNMSKDIPNSANNTTNNSITFSNLPQPRDSSNNLRQSGHSIHVSLREQNVLINLRESHNSHNSHNSHITLRDPAYQSNSPNDPPQQQLIDKTEPSSPIINHTQVTMTPIISRPGSSGDDSSTSSYIGNNTARIDEFNCLPVGLRLAGVPLSVSCSSTAQDSSQLHQLYPSQPPSVVDYDDPLQPNRLNFFTTKVHSDKHPDGDDDGDGDGDGDGDNHLEHMNKNGQNKHIQIHHGHFSTPFSQTTQNPPSSPTIATSPRKLSSGPKVVLYGDDNESTPSPTSYITTKNTQTQSQQQTQHGNVLTISSSPTQQTPVSYSNQFPPKLYKPPTTVIELDSEETSFLSNEPTPTNLQKQNFPKSSSQIPHRYNIAVGATGSILDSEYLSQDSPINLTSNNNTPPLTLNKNKISSPAISTVSSRVPCERREPRGSVVFPIPYHDFVSHENGKSHVQIPPIPAEIHVKIHEGEHELDLVHRNQQLTPNGSSKNAPRPATQHQQGHFVGNMPTSQSTMSIRNESSLATQLMRINSNATTGNDRNNIVIGNNTYVQSGNLHTSVSSLQIQLQPQARAGKSVINYALPDSMGNQAILDGRSGEQLTTTRQTDTVRAARRASILTRSPTVLPPPPSLTPATYNHAIAGATSPNGFGNQYSTVHFTQEPPQTPTNYNNMNNNHPQPSPAPLLPTTLSRVASRRASVTPVQTFNHNAALSSTQSHYQSMLINIHDEGPEYGTRTESPTAFLSANFFPSQQTQQISSINFSNNNTPTPFQPLNILHSNPSQQSFSANAIHTGNSSYQSYPQPLLSPTQNTIPTTSPTNSSSSQFTRPQTPQTRAINHKAPQPTPILPIAAISIPVSRPPSSASTLNGVDGSLHKSPSTGGKLPPPLPPTMRTNSQISHHSIPPPLPPHIILAQQSSHQSRPNSPQPPQPPPPPPPPLNLRNVHTTNDTLSFNSNGGTNGRQINTSIPDNTSINFQFSPTHSQLHNTALQRSTSSVATSGTVISTNFDSSALQSNKYATFRRASMAGGIMQQPMNFNHPSPPGAPP